MHSQTLVVTPPDDVLLDGIRFLLFDLTPEQTQIVSDSLRDIDYQERIILYHCDASNSNWLFDKKLKSDLIIFNAESSNELLVGYLSAHANAHYIGTLRSLDAVTGRAIYTIDQCKQLLMNCIENYEI